MKFFSGCLLSRPKCIEIHIFFVLNTLCISQHRYDLRCCSVKVFNYITPQQLPPTTGHHVAPTLDCWKTITTLSNHILPLEPCQHICEDDSHGNGGATVAGGPSVSRGTTQELYWQIWTEAKGPSGHRHQCMDQLPTTEAHGRFH